jgi:hypothetical protein
MTFIREFKFIFPVNEDSILAAALDNMFNITDVKQLSMICTPACEEADHSLYRFNVQWFYFDSILEVTKKLCKATLLMSPREYESLTLGNDTDFANTVMMNMFARFPDIINDQGFYCNL